MIITAEGFGGLQVSWVKCLELGLAHRNCLVNVGYCNGEHV